MISAELTAEIRRLYEVEGWRPNTIARQLGVHHGTVRRALERCGVLERAAVSPRRRPSKLDPYLAFIRDLLKRYPRLPATQVHEMLRRRGYRGGPDHVRHRIAELGLRPRRKAEAFLMLRTLPGEQAQVDWAHFDHRKVEGGERRLYCFVMVLSYSRRIFIRFFYDAGMVSFLTGHVEAFSFFDGVARCLLYDNLRSAVLERRLGAIRFHPRLLELADHYGFEPRPVAPRRGNEKGRVERAIRYVRGTFYPLRAGLELDQLNREAIQWCEGMASERRWPQDRRRTVEQAYLEERAHLLSLPASLFVCHEHNDVEVHSSPYVQVDCNRYSIPHDRVGRVLTVFTEADRVRILDRSEVIAEHRRSWGKGQVVEDPAHVEALWQEKRAARLHRGQHRLLEAVPRAEELLSAMAKRQRHLGTAVDQLLGLLDEHGRVELEAAVAEAVDKGSPHPQTVRLVLDRRQRAHNVKPPVPVRLPDRPEVRDLTVVPHALAGYDPDDPEEDQ
jgi:transposase